MTTETLRDYKVRDFMSRNVATVTEETNVRSAIELMVVREVGSLVVVDDGRAVGLLTERDLLAGIAEGPSLDQRKTVDLMDAVVTKVGPETISQEAARMMTDAKGRLLAFEGDRMVGIVTATDIVRAVWRIGAAFEIADMVSSEVVSTEGWMPLLAVVKMMKEHRVGSVILTDRKVPRAIFTERDLLNRVLYPRLGLDQPAIRAATVPLVSAEAGITGHEAAQAMVSRKIKRLPLTKEGKLVGIVTARDIVEAYAYRKGGTKTELEIQMAVKYGELCPICHTRIDDRGLCGCGTIGGG